MIAIETIQKWLDEKAAGAAGLCGPVRFIGTNTSTIVHPPPLPLLHTGLFYDVHGLPQQPLCLHSPTTPSVDPNSGFPEDDRLIFHFRHIFRKWATHTARRSSAVGAQGSLSSGMLHFLFIDLFYK